MDHPQNLIGLLLLVLACPGLGEEPASVETPYVVRYDNSPDLPDGIAFHTTLMMLNAFNAQPGGSDAESIVMQELGLPEGDASGFLSRALTSLHLMNEQVGEELEAHRCEYAGSELTLKQKYAGLQASYAIALAVYEQHYEETLQGLDAETAERLQRWIDRQKLNIGYEETDFERADALSGKDRSADWPGPCRYRRG